MATNVYLQQEQLNRFVGHIKEAVIIAANLKLLCIYRYVVFKFRFSSGNADLLSVSMQIKIYTDLSSLCSFRFFVKKSSRV